MNNKFLPAWVIAALLLVAIFAPERKVPYILPDFKNLPELPKIQPVQPPIPPKEIAPPKIPEEKRQPFNRNRRFFPR